MNKKTEEISSIQKNSIERYDWVDALRAIAMILVVYGHQVQGLSIYFVFTSPIKLPLFFAISGYLIKVDVDIKTFLYKLLRQLVIPWLLLTITPRIVLLPIKGWEWTFNSIIEIITGQSYWYLPCLIVAEILWYIINKISSKKKIAVILLSAACLILGLLFHNYNILRIFMINTALISQVYLLIGRVYSENKFRIKPLARMIAIVGCAVYILLGVVYIFLYPNKYMDIHNNVYYNVIICIAMSYIGVIAISTFSEFILCKHFRLLCILGKHTMVVYIFHTTVLSVCLYGLSYVGLHENHFVFILFTLLSCAVCCLVSVFLHRFCPWMFGCAKKKAH